VSKITGHVKTFAEGTNKKEKTLSWFQAATNVNSMTFKDSSFLGCFIMLTGI